MAIVTADNTDWVLCAPGPCDVSVRGFALIHTGLVKPALDNEDYDEIQSKRDGGVYPYGGTENVYMRSPTSAVVSARVTVA